MDPQCTAVLLAAGRGSRMAAGANKVYLEVAGRPLLSYSLDVFSSAPWIDEIVLVVARGEEPLAAEAVEDIIKPVRVVPGGRRRQDSSLEGVHAASGEIVLIHDVARPFPSLFLIERVVQGTREHDACVPVLPVADTLRYRDKSGFLSPADLKRGDLYRIQTPQGFQRALIERCLRESEEREYTDDAAAVLATDLPVWTVAGEATNIKLTTSEDLEFATAMAPFFTFEEDS
jgi:2-C-methyl-D-erythritol 4-phosphate cytidylyltransferase